MASFIVMEPPSDGLGTRPEGTRLIRDGFSWLAFILPPFWLLWHRLWFAAVLAFIVLGALSFVGESQGLAVAGSLLTLLVSLVVGFEGAALRAAALRRAGWTEWGVVEAENLADAETRYAFGRETSEPAVEPTEFRQTIVPAANPARSVQTGMALGLSHPGRH
ncbi:MAG: DUF2628 domain-containing protein [Aquamicrobium sp.]|uniref:DUF2628 domain-containing protein n=1 Tax=Mesorhizobium sp. Pch-S TaxID=2082387 RepID=UPI00101347CD|nr:DUF2628 domain-containing protein [Mesorhizobium sp. Pch-S]MBR2692182.1 DUF2628 domain-containing protein [Aquamicrobium sp.]QAZ43266.1 DUF2628 domain-containing protein [Mesorhizobium sp. Pch-S]